MYKLILKVGDFSTTVESPGPFQTSVFHLDSGNLGPETVPVRLFLRLTANQPNKYWCGVHKMAFDGLGKGTV